MQPNTAPTEATEVSGGAGSQMVGAVVLSPGVARYRLGEGLVTALSSALAKDPANAPLERSAS